MRVVKILCILLGIFLLLAAGGLGAAGALNVGGGATAAPVAHGAQVTPGAAQAHATPLAASNEPGDISNLKLYHKKTVMTVAYKAYGNPEAADGKYWLGKLVVENTGKGPIRDLRVSYEIPDYVGWSTPDVVPVLLPGQTYVQPIYPKLPAKVAQLRTRTPATLEVKLQYTSAGRAEEKIVKRDFEFRGVTEIEYTSLPYSEIVNWYDLFDNYELLAAYCMDQDEAVQLFLGKVGEVHGGVSTADNAEKIAAMLAKIYEFQRKVGMTYTSAKGFPEKIGDVQSMVQNVRLPREVIQTNGGLCIELALLMCSLCDAAGAKSKLVLIPGHAYALIEADDGSELAFECTGVGEGRYGNSLNWMQALKTGMEEIKKVRRGEIPGRIIDLHYFQAQGIRPPELSQIDKDSLTRLLNERLAAAGTRVVSSTGTPGTTGTPNAGRAATPVNVLIPFPRDWVDNNASIVAFQKAVPACKLMATDAAGDRYVQWFYFGNQKDPAAFEKSAQEWGKAAGLTYRFGSSRLATVGKKPATMQPFTLESNKGGTFKGELYVVETTAGAVYIVYAGSESSDLRSVIDASLPKVEIH